MLLSPRLKNILLLLLNSEAPLPASDLARHLHISKRTVFRELECADFSLAAYDVRLDTKSKKGISLQGSPQSKEELRRELSETELPDPKNASERQRRLILELLRLDAPIKIYSLAQLLSVSESTVNHDLDGAEKFLTRNHVSLIRKPGLGVYLDYEEENYRKSCVRFIRHSAGESLKALQNLLPQGVCEAVNLAVRESGHNKLINMTDSSLNGFIVFLAVAVWRISLQKHLTGHRELTRDELWSDDYDFVRRIGEALEERLGFEISPAEIASFFIYVQGTRRQHAELADEAKGDFDLRAIICEMIHRYDARAAFELKNDREFVEGLMAHLNPAIARLKSGHDIFNPFQREILEMYPDIYAKTQKAVEALEEALGCAVAEDEVGLLALHFGGASVRLSARARPRRPVHIGVVCASGIGVSILLSSRLSHIFHDKVKVRSLSQAELEKNGAPEVDCVISTLPLELPSGKYLHVHPMLTDNDIAAIAEKIEVLAETQGPVIEARGADFLSLIEEIKQVSAEISSLLRAFRLFHLPGSTSFHNMIQRAGQLIGTNPAEAEALGRALVERESLSTQKIPEYGLIFLHAKSAFVFDPVFFVMRAEGNGFSAPDLADFTAAVVMFIPESDRPHPLAISAISREIFENEIFLNLIKTGGEAELKSHLEGILNRHLTERIHTFKNCGR